MIKFIISKPHGLSFHMLGASRGDVCNKLRAMLGRRSLPYNMTVEAA